MHRRPQGSTASHSDSISLHVRARNLHFQQAPPTPRWLGGSWPEDHTVRNFTCLVKCLSLQSFIYAVLFDPLDGPAKCGLQPISQVKKQAQSGMSTTLGHTASERPG